MDIKEIRKKIDELDQQILKLLNERASCAMEIGKMKASTAAPTYAPERELQVMEQVRRENHGPLDDQAVQAVFREIISASRALEKPLVVAYWGPPGSNTHIASVQKFGYSTEFVPVDTITDIFSEVEHRRANYGVTPVENSTEGVINHTLDMFAQSELRICSEIFVNISHNLLSTQDDLSGIKKIYSQPQPTGQCRNWLRANAPEAQIVEVSTTARAAMLAAEDPASAAIASKLSAELYGLKVLYEGIEDNPHNRTRFLIVGHTKPAPSGRDKTSIVFSVPHRAGALFRALSVFEEEKINMTMIESRPTKQMPWEYVFFVDIQGHEKDEVVGRALRKLSEQALFVRVLGSYPEAE